MTRVPCFMPGTRLVRRLGEDVARHGLADETLGQGWAQPARLGDVVKGCAAVEGHVVGKTELVDGPQGRLVGELEAHLPQGAPGPEPEALCLVELVHELGPGGVDVGWEALAESPVWSRH